MLTISDCQLLRDSYSSNSETTMDVALRNIGHPSPEQLVDFALQQMQGEDRNVRVLMLRILAHQNGERAARGVLAGLRDRTRRVCSVAIQACPNYLHDEAIVQQLVAIAGDDGRKLKLRRRALSMLAGDEGRWGGDLTPAVFAALKVLMRLDDCPFAIVFGLVRLDAEPRLQSLLHEFAKSRDTAEAQLARRAVSGERVIHIDNYSDNLPMQRHIMKTCEIAHGRMYYWLPREAAQVSSPA